MPVHKVQILHVEEKDLEGHKFEVLTLSHELHYYSIFSDTPKCKEQLPAFKVVVDNETFGDLNYPRPIFRDVLGTGTYTEKHLNSNGGDPLGIAIADAYRQFKQEEEDTKINKKWANTIRLLNKE